MVCFSDAEGRAGAGESPLPSWASDPVGKLVCEAAGNKASVTTEGKANQDVVRARRS